MPTTPSTEYYAIPKVRETETDITQATNDALDATDEALHQVAEDASTPNPIELPDVVEPIATANKLYSVSGLLKWAGKHLARWAGTPAASKVITSDASGLLLGETKQSGFNLPLGTLNNTVARGSSLPTTFTSANRLSTVPDYAGQIGTEVDTGKQYYATGVSAGNWASYTPTGGSGATLIASYTVAEGDTLNSFTFNAIPGTYSNLRFVLRLRGSYSSEGYNNVYLRFNADGGPRYPDANAGSYMYLGPYILSASDGPKALMDIRVPGYAVPAPYYCVIGNATYNSGGSAAGGTWAPTSAPSGVTSVTFYAGNTSAPYAGSSFEVWGIN